MLGRAQSSLSAIVERSPKRHGSGGGAKKVAAPFEFDQIPNLQLSQRAKLWQQVRGKRSRSQQDFAPSVRSSNQGVSLKLL